MNNQQIFDTVTAHLRKQKVAAYKEGRGCRYRTPEGLSCAAGCLIADKFYNASFEGLDIRDLSVEKAVTASIGPYNKLMLYSVQETHDNYMPRSGSNFGDMSVWELQMRKLAKNFNLVYTPPAADMA